jgi:hypothetical protein
MLEKWFALLNSLPSDKVFHFASGTVLFAMFWHLTGWWAMLIVAMIAASKEGYDYLHRDTHTPELMDALATIGGAVVCASVLA